MDKRHTYNFAKRNFYTADCKRGGGFVQSMLDAISNPLATRVRSSRGFGKRRSTYLLRDF